MWLSGFDFQFLFQKTGKHWDLPAAFLTVVEYSRISLISIYYSRNPDTLVVEEDVPKCWSFNVDNFLVLIVSPTLSTSLAMRSDPQFPGPSASLVESE